MGIIAPNQKKLIVPRKNAKIPTAPVSQSDHDANMRAIETWANAQAPGGVQQLIAGTNITLDPTDGTGIVTINASGGGGGSAGIYGSVACGMDSELYPFAQWLGPTNPSLESVMQIGPINNTDPNIVQYTWGTSWVTGTNGGQSMLFLPIFGLPAFSNAGSDPCEFEFYIQVWDFSQTYTNYCQYTGVVNIPTTGGNVQCTTGDLTTESPAGGDLSLVSGTGTSGNGIVSAGGVTAYLCSISGILAVPASTTFS
jgi:hypothetical protein